MARVEDIAKFYICLAADQTELDSGDLMTNLRLQKILYFAQGHYLAKYGTPLFDSEFEAWDYGPICPAIYHRYSKFKRNGITDEEQPFENVFTEQEEDMLFAVFIQYDKYSTDKLVDMTNEDGTPWKRYYRENAIGIRIPDAETRKYFSSLSIKTFDDVLPKFIAKAEHVL